MGVPCQVPASATGGRVCELKAKGEEKCDDTLDKRLAIVEPTNVGGFVLKSTAMVRLCRVRGAALPMCHPQVIESRQLMRPNVGHTLKYQDNRTGFRA
jgi:hypothetical protein